MRICLLFLNKLVPLEENAMESVEKGQRDAALQFVFGEDYKTQIKMIDQLKLEFLDMLDKRTELMIHNGLVKSRILTVVTFLFILFVVLMQFLSFYVTKRKILKPIIAVRNEMGEIARGNLSTDFSLEPDTSEIGMLISSMLNTKQELKKYIGNIEHCLSLMAEGDMNLDVDIEYIGDFLPIKQAMETILHSLNNTLMQINQAAEQVSSSSH